MTRPIISVEKLSKRYVLGGGAHNLMKFSLSNAIADKFLAFRRRLVGAAPAAGPAEFWALRDVDMEVERGRVIGLIGRNGAGKSTMLKILSRIVEPTSGTARLRGRVASLLEVGTGFHLELTGRENIFLNGAILGMRRAEVRRKFDEIVTFAEVERFLDTPVKRYSSGMFVRLAFAVAAHLEPEILIVDEVLSVGDYAFQKKCLGKMREVAYGDGRTVLFVSHNMGVLGQLCDDGVWLDKGRVVARGPIDDVLRAYTTRDSDAVSAARFEPDPSKGQQFLRVDLLHEDGAANGDFTTDEPIRVRMEYLVRRGLMGCAIQFVIQTQDGLRVLLSDVRERNPEYTEEFTPGRYVLEAVVPADLLAPASYSLSVRVGEIGNGWIDDRPDCREFTIHNLSAESVSKGSVLNLPLRWTCERREDATVEPARPPA